MPAPLPIELRERVVAAYESGHESYDLIAAQFGVARRALQRWVKLKRETRSVAPRARGGGNFSPVDLPLLEKIVAKGGSATSHEISADYNAQVARRDRVHRSSIQRALRRAGFVFKKNGYVCSSSRDLTSKKSVGDFSAD
jgi:transposase